MYRGFRQLSVLMAIMILFSGVSVSKVVAAPSGKQVKIGMVLALTGYLAATDRAARSGAELAIKYINDHGGINGSQLVGIIEDMKSQPQDGATAVSKLIFQDKVQFILTGYSSAGAAAEQPIVVQNEIPMVAACILPAKPEGVFAFYEPPKFVAEAMLQYAKAKGYANVGLMNNTTPYAQQVAAYAKQAAPAMGVNIVGIEEHKSDATSLSVPLTRLKAKNPSAILEVGSGPALLLAAKDMQALGMSIPLIIPNDDLSILKQVVDIKSDTYFLIKSIHLYPNLPNPEQKAALDAFMPIWNAASPGQDPNPAARAWDAVMTIAQAAKSANSNNYKKLIGAMENLSFWGASWECHFTPSDHYAMKTNPYIVADYEGGSIKQVFTPKN